MKPNEPVKVSSANGLNLPEEADTIRTLDMAEVAEGTEFYGLRPVDSSESAEWQL